MTRSMAVKALLAKFGVPCAKLYILRGQNPLLGAIFAIEANISFSQLDLLDTFTVEM